MTVVNFDRDLILFHKQSSNTQVTATDDNLHPDLQRFRSDGVVYPFSCHSASPTFFDAQTIATISTRGVSVNLTGPDVTGGSPYSVKASASYYSSTPIDRLGVGLALCFIVPAATISNASAGNESRRMIVLKTATNDLTFDDIVYVPPYGILYNGLGFENSAVGFGFLFCNFTAGTITIRPCFSLNVQRLSVAPEQIITAVR